MPRYVNEECNYRMPYLYLSFWQKPWILKFSQRGGSTTRFHERLQKSKNAFTTPVMSNVSFLLEVHKRQSFLSCDSDTSTEQNWEVERNLKQQLIHPNANIFLAASLYLFHRFSVDFFWHVLDLIMNTNAWYRDRCYLQFRIFTTYQLATSTAHSFTMVSAIVWGSFVSLAILNSTQFFLGVYSWLESVPPYFQSGWLDFKYSFCVFRFKR